MRTDFKLGGVSLVKQIKGCDLSCVDFWAVPLHKVQRQKVASDSMGSLHNVANGSNTLL